MSERAQRLLQIADDELVLGWQTPNGQASRPSSRRTSLSRRLPRTRSGTPGPVRLAAGDLHTTADELAFDRPPEEYRCAPFVELRLMDWADTIARRVLYEGPTRSGSRRSRPIPTLSWRASQRKWIARRSTTASTQKCGPTACATSRAFEPRSTRSGARLLGVLDAELAAVLAERAPAQLGWMPATAAPAARNGHSEGFRELWDEMTMVRRSIPGASW